MITQMNRRDFLQTSATAAALTVTAGFKTAGAAAPDDFDVGRHIYKSLKWDMIREGATTLDKFKLLKEVGYDGVELDSPVGVDKKEALEASRKTGLPIEGIVNSTHWNIRHSDPDPAVSSQHHEITYVKSANILAAIGWRHGLAGRRPNRLVPARFGCQ